MHKRGRRGGVSPSLCFTLYSILWVRFAFGNVYMIFFTLCILQVLVLHSVFCRCLGDGAGWSSGAWTLQILGRWDFSVPSKKMFHGEEIRFTFQY